MGCVYLATSPSGKQYVGITIRTVEARWVEHCREARAGRGYALHSAIRKYGDDAFTIEVLLETDDEQALFAREVTEIHERQCVTPLGYNITKGGDMCVLSPEAEERRVAALLVAFATPEYKIKKSASVKSVRSRPEVKAKFAETHATPEFKAKRSAAMTASNARPEVKAKKSAALKAWFAQPECKEAWVANHKINMARPEVRAKMSASSKISNAERCANVFADGLVFSSKMECDRMHSLTSGVTYTRVKSTSPRFRWWHTIPNHNDPACDAVEYTWAVIQWAKANPDHPNVPAWAQQRGAEAA
jgi:hypothetical protein